MDQDPTAEFPKTQEDVPQNRPVGDPLAPALVPDYPGSAVSLMSESNKLPCEKGIVYTFLNTVFKRLIDASKQKDSTT